MKQIWIMYYDEGLERGMTYLEASEYADTESVKYIADMSDRLKEERKHGKMGLRSR